MVGLLGCGVLGFRIFRPLGSLGFRVLGFRVLGLRVLGLGFKFWSVGFRVWGVEFRVLEEWIPRVISVSCLLSILVSHIFAPTNQQALSPETHGGGVPKIRV